MDSPMPNDQPRLIEVAFPLKQASLDSVHEKSVRHGHISTLHIWPARRPLAASRAALIATLLPDPGNKEERDRLLERLAGKVVRRNIIKRTNGRETAVVKEETEGGILHWGRENGPDLDFFRAEIRKAYGGRAPRVLDPFAGGGAIPLEAMRLGCDVTAVDINPVAWFILKCTLEYPQRLTGQTLPLPGFALESETFMAAYWKATGTGKNGRGKPNAATESQPSLLEPPEADLSWHVRAWGHWVLERARQDLERFYPEVEGKPTVAYLWARTVTCKNCRATIPLLKTLWLCKKETKRFRLVLKPKADHTGVGFEVLVEAVVGVNGAQRRTYDLRLGQGTMSRSGAWCPSCGGPGTVAMTSDDIRAEGMAGRLGAQMTAVVVNGHKGKEYRLPTASEIQAASDAADCVDEVFEDIPFGLPTESVPKGSSRRGGGSAFTAHLYGIQAWYQLFTPRQLLALGTFVRHTRAARAAMCAEGYRAEWVEAMGAYLAAMLDRLANQSSAVSRWNMGGEKIEGTFARFALPILWDYAELNPLAETTGAYTSAIDWVSLTVEHLVVAAKAAPPPEVTLDSAISTRPAQYDAIVTDPPYYDAIPYSDLMDFFYVWLRRVLKDAASDYDGSFHEPLGPKWNQTENDGELIDDSSRFGGDPRRSKVNYEDGMFRAFEACQRCLVADGRLVVVFANKSPDAWETLVSATIRAGFVVYGSWPIQTEMTTRTRALSSAALASSVWLVCRKRPETARPGWDNQVLDEMRDRIHDRLREFWDAGIRGPDFVWAATGPAMEAYSRHPVVKKADEPGSLMTVSEFLQHVRRMVVDYVVGKVMSQNGDGQAAEGLDDPTLYYLLHRNDFGLAEAPVGASILYAQSCNLRDRDLIDRHDLLAYGKGQAAEATDGDEEDDTADESEEEPAMGSGNTVKLKRWDQRRHRDLGVNQGPRLAPLIDQVHHLMHLWREGDVQRVDGYLESQGLRRNPLFPRLLQAIIELARKDNQPDERALLETIMNHVTARGAHPQMPFSDQEAR